MRLSLSTLLLLWLAMTTFAVIDPSSGKKVDTEIDIFTASRKGDVLKVKAFLESGSGVSSRDSKGNTPLIIACGRGHHDVISLLLQQGASFEEATSGGIFEGKNTLAWASSQGRLKAVVALLQAGANPQHVQQVGVFAGKTPLMWAASQGRTEIVNLLISAGAEVDFASQSGNFRGKNSLMWASSQGRVQTVATLLIHGSDVNKVDNDKMSALMWAAGSEARDTKHQKGLMEKAMKGHVDVVRLLLRYGAQVDMRDTDGITALMYACFHGHAGAVSVLLNAGADADFQNKAGHTALHLALTSGFNAAAEAVKTGPTIMSLPIDDVLQIPTCGWVLSVLRAPRGTGIYTVPDPLASGHSAESCDVDAQEYSGAPASGKRHVGTPSCSSSIYSLSNACSVLNSIGLDDTLGDVLLIAHYSSVYEVIQMIFQNTNFAAHIRAKAQLYTLYNRWLDFARHNEDLSVQMERPADALQSIKQRLEHADSSDDFIITNERAQNESCSRDSMKDKSIV